jgi:hypothetical protein
MVRRDSRGNYYATAVSQDQIIRYDSTGRFAATIGKRGRDRGELMGLRDIAVGPGDTLYAIEWSGNGISLFNSSNVFVKRWPSPTDAMIQVLWPFGDGGAIINADLAVPDHVGFPLHILSGSGELVASLGGEMPVRPDRFSERRRLLASGPNSGTVWVAWITNYRLELWDKSGTLQRTLEANVPWSPTHDTTPKKPFYEAPPRPGLMMFAKDTGGFLWVYTSVSDEKWRADRRLRGQELSALVNRRYRSRFFDTIIDVIDPESGALITSRRISDAISGGFASTDGRYVFTRWEDEVGMVRIDIWRVRLVQSL